MYDFDWRTCNWVFCTNYNSSKGSKKCFFLFLYKIQTTHRTVKRHRDLWKSHTLENHLKESCLYFHVIWSQTLYLWIFLINCDCDFSLGHILHVRAHLWKREKLFLSERTICSTSVELFKACLAVRGGAEEDFLTVDVRSGLARDTVTLCDHLDSSCWQ